MDRALFRHASEENTPSDVTHPVKSDALPASSARPYVNPSLFFVDDNLAPNKHVFF